MTEAEWLSCEDTLPMLRQLQANKNPRKWRLLACACSRVGLDTLADDERFPLALDIAEGFADDEVTDQVRREMRQKTPLRISSAMVRNLPHAPCFAHLRRT